MGSEKFCLRWNDFESNISGAFRELRDDKDFFDVTLACEDEQIQAHKVILSACSPFFRNILRRNPHPSPLLYLNGVKYADILAVLNFMYHGEVNVAQEELNSFLAVAEDLKVKGLTQSQSETETTSRNPKTPTSKPINTKPLSRPPPDRIINPPPLKRLNAPQSTIHHPTPSVDDDIIEEVVPIKSEPRESHPMPIHHTPDQPTGYSRPQPIALTPIEDQSLTTYQEESGYEEYEQYEEEQQFGEVNNLQGMGGEFDKAGKRTGHMEDEFEKYFKSNSALIEGGAWSCFLCGKVTAHIGNMRQHFESHHFSLGAIQCEVCEKIFKTKHSLATHMSKVHRDR